VPKTIELTEVNSVFLDGQVDAFSIPVIIDKINNLEKDQELYIYINSQGGSVFAGIELVELLNYTDKKITCIARSAISMAFSIFQACPTRLVTPYAILMQHRIAGAMQGTPEELKSRAQLGNDLEELLNISDSKRLGISLKEFENLVRYEYWIVGATNIIKSKAADDVTLVKLPKKIEK
jgi:ATP-dependent protease ClpP protease subunit